jgi:hypothetical protein
MSKKGGGRRPPFSSLAPIFLKDEKGELFKKKLVDKHDKKDMC